MSMQRALSIEVERHGLKAKSAAKADSLQRRLHVEVLEERQLLSATPQLLKDINQAPLNPTNLTVVGSSVFFDCEFTVPCSSER